MLALLQSIFRNHPDFAAAVRGAGDAEIAELEKYAGPLPPAYREFLRAMGHDYGRLALPPRSSFRHADVFKVHYAGHGRRKRKAAGDPRARKRLEKEQAAEPSRLLIGADVNCDDPHSYFIDLAEPATLPVFEDSECCGRRERAATLEEFLFAGAFGREVIERLRERGQEPGRP